MTRKERTQISDPQPIPYCRRCGEDVEEGTFTHRWPDGGRYHNVDIAYTMPMTKPATDEGGGD